MHSFLALHGKEEANFSQSLWPYAASSQAMARTLTLQAAGRDPAQVGWEKTSLSGP